jgi:uncharacterized protein YpmB
LALFLFYIRAVINTKLNKQKTNKMKKVMLTVAAAVLMSALSFAQDAAKPAQEKKDAPKKEATKKDDKKAAKKDDKKADTKEVKKTDAPK